MLKALFKKQFLELNSFYFRDRKTGKNRSPGKTAAYIILFALLFIYLGVVFFFLSMGLTPILESETPWLYYSMMGIMALLFGVIGSVFNTYSGLYHAKDNDLLLSMPISPMKILLVRISGVGLMSLLYESIIFIPAMLARFIFAPASASCIVCSILTYLALEILITSISCILGWLVALLSSKFKNKSIITVIFALLFFVIYYYCISKANEFVEKLLLMSEKFGGVVKTWLYPFYLMGNAAEGDGLSMLLFGLGAVVLFLIVLFALSKTFIAITADKKSSAKAVYKEKKAKASSASASLLKRELRHFVSSPTYMLNCGLGTVLLPAAAIAAIIKAGDLRPLISALASEGMPEGAVCALALAVVILLASMNDVTAPSVSLEGKSIWIVTSMPLSTWQVLRAKLNMHLLLTVIPIAFCSVALAIVLKADLLTGVLLLIAACVFTAASGAFGLMLNLLKPNLSWSSETIPVKQGMSVMIAIFGCWGVAIIVGALYFLLSAFIRPWLYIALWAVIFAVLTVLLYKWLRTKGTALFEDL